MLKWTYNVHYSLTSKDKLTLSRLTCHYNQSINQSNKAILYDLCQLLSDIIIKFLDDFYLDYIIISMIIILILVTLIPATNLGVKDSCNELCQETCF